MAPCTTFAGPKDYSRKVVHAHAPTEKRCVPTEQKSGGSTGMLSQEGQGKEIAVPLLSTSQRNRWLATTFSLQTKKNIQTFAKKNMIDHDDVEGKD